MHHENRVVIVEHENNLKMATAASTTPDEPLVVVDSSVEKVAERSGRRFPLPRDRRRDRIDARYSIRSSGSPSFALDLII
jgi:hypothetical protein